MQYDVNTAAEYLAALENDWRAERLLALRQLILQAAPDWREGIQYKMLSYADQGGAVMHLNAQKRYVSLYVGNISKIDPEGRLLRGASTGKGCIRFGPSTDVARSGVEAFIKAAVARRSNGVDIGC